MKGASHSFAAYTSGNWEYFLGFIFAPGKIAKLKPRIAYRVDPTTSIVGSVGVSWEKLTFGPEINYDLSPNSKVFMGLKGGFEFNQNGAYWLSGMKFGFTYHGLSLSVPVMLGNFNETSNKYSLIFTLSAMAACTAAFCGLMFWDRRKKRRPESQLEDRYRRVVDGYVNYRSLNDMLERYAEQKRGLEELNDGLIILQAYYGSHNAIRELQQSPDRRPAVPQRDNMQDYLDCQAIDVTRMLQIMVPDNIIAYR